MKNTRFYVGPVDAIVAHIDGRDVFLNRGESVEVSDATAEAMDRTPDNWSPEAPDKKQAPSERNDA